MTVDRRAPEDPHRPVRVLTVCTGNICRSPYAAALLREGLERVRPGVFEVSSAGTNALTGRPMDPGSASRLAARGAEDPGFRARLLTGRLLTDQDLVLVMSGRHRDVVLEEAPAVHRRTLGMLDLAAALQSPGGHDAWVERLRQAGAEDAVARWRALPQLVARERGRRAGRVTDVPDPYGRGDAAFDSMAVSLDAAVAGVIAWEAGFDR